MRRLRSLRPLTWVIVFVQAVFAAVLAAAAWTMFSNSLCQRGNSCDPDDGFAAAVSILVWIAPAWIFVTYVLMVNWLRRQPLRCPGCREPLTSASPTCTSCGLRFVAAQVSHPG